MKSYRYIILNESDYADLSSAYKDGSKHHYRERCHAILLSHQGLKISELSILFNKQEDTIRGWFNKWESEGLKGLGIRKGRGLKPRLSIFNVELVELVKKKSKNSP